MILAPPCRIDSGPSLVAAGHTFIGEHVPAVQLGCEAHQFRCRDDVIVLQQLRQVFVEELGLNRQALDHRNPSGRVAQRELEEGALRVVLLQQLVESDAGIIFPQLVLEPLLDVPALDMFGCGLVVLGHGCRKVRKVGAFVFAKLVGPDRVGHFSPRNC